MLVTSLSVPGVHLKCKAFPSDMTQRDKLWHAWRIASTLGSAISGTLRHMHSMRYTSVTYTDEPQGVDGGHFGDAARAGAAELDPYH